MKKYLLILTALVLLLQQVNTRFIDNQFFMSSLKSTDGWLYLTKMALRVGKIDIKIKTSKIAGTARNNGGEIILNIIPDTRWEQEKQKKCKNLIQSPILTHELLMQGYMSISEHEVNIEKEQLYYFVIKDCGKKFESDYSNQQLQIKIQLQIINSGDHMGEDEDHWVTFPVVIALGLWVMVSDKYFLRAEFQSDPDYAKMILFGAIATNISSLMWRSFGYLIYYFMGSNYLLFHIIYLFMHSISESMVLTLLILVSMGWSLNFLQGPKFDIAIPIISVVGILNIVLSLMTQLNNSSHDMHHSFDAPSGSVLLIMRVLVGVGFLISVLITRTSSRYRIKQFLCKFGVFGFMYICSMPGIVTLANSFLPAKQRNQFVFVGVEAIKSVCNISLMYMLSSSRSEYNKLCYKNASFLPSETGLF